MLLYIGCIINTSRDSLGKLAPLTTTSGSFTTESLLTRSTSSATCFVVKVGTWWNLQRLRSLLCTVFYYTLLRTLTTYTVLLLLRLHTTLVTTTSTTYTHGLLTTLVYLLHLSPTLHTTCFKKV